MPEPKDNLAAETTPPPFKPIYVNKDVQEHPLNQDKPVYYYPLVHQRYNQPIPPPTWRQTQRMMKQGPANGVPNPNAGLTYWEYPSTVVRYHNLIRTAPPGWKAPDWLDVDAVNFAYDYLKYRNQGTPWQEWKALNPADPAIEVMKNLSIPPAEALWKTDKGTVLTDAQVKEQQPFGDWDNLETWQKWALGLMSPQTPYLKDRPEWTRLTASGGQALLMGVGVGMAVSAVATPVAGIFAGLAATAGLTYQSYTGNKVPILNEIVLASNVLSEGFERAWSLQKQIKVDGIEEVLSEFPAAWKAGAVSNETAKTNVLNAMARAFGDDPAGANQVWRFETGETEPVTLTGDLTGKKGAEELGAVRDWIDSGVAQTAFDRATIDGSFNGTYQEYIYSTISEQYGITGTVNDLVAQTIFDPLNFVPGFMGKIGEVTTKSIASKATDVNTIRVAGDLSAAFKKGQGSIIIDALPFGIQQIVSGITKIPGSKGLLEVKNMYRDWVRTGYHPSALLNAPVDMVKMYDSLLKGGVNKNDINVLHDVITWKDPSSGETKAYNSPSGADFTLKLPTVDELSPFEKFMGGIDTTYGLKELTPTKGKTFVQKLTLLTPEAQTNAILNIFHHNVSTLMDAASGNPGAMAGLMQKLSGIVDTKSGDLGEAILKSPAARVVQAAMQYAMKDGDLAANMLASWVSGAERRGMLDKIAAALGEKPADVLEQLKENPAVMAQRLNKIAPELKTTPEALTETLKVFLGDDALPWSAEQFQANLVNAFADKMDGYFKDKYGLAPENWVFRVSNALKGVQSLVLLGFNPAYFMNNWVNNVITRAADGVGGHMTAKQVNEFYVRLGVFPKDSGLSGFDEITGAIISRATKAQTDVLGKVQKGITYANKFGIFSRLSGAMEKAEGNQARVIATNQFLDKTKKAGVGIRKMPLVLEHILDTQYPGMKEKVYAAINAGMNMKEIEASLFTTVVKPAVESIVDTIDQKYSPNTPGVTRDLLRKMGIIDRLNDYLKTEDIDGAISHAESDFNDWIEKQHVETIKNQAEEAKNATQSERIPYVFQKTAEMAMENGQKWVNQRTDWDRLYAQLDNGEVTQGQFNNLASELQAKHSAEMQRFNEYQLQVQKGMIEGLGLDTDYSRGFVTSISDMNDVWKTFWKDSNKLKRDYFSQGETKTITWEDVESRTADLYDKATKAESTIQKRMDDLFGKMYADYTGWDATKASKWRTALMLMRENIVKAQQEMRIKTRGMTQVEKALEYSSFNQKYNRMIADMKQFEHDGAFELMNKPAPEAKIDVPEVANPAIDAVRQEENRAMMRNQGYTEQQINELAPKMAEGTPVAPKPTDLAAEQAMNVEPKGPADAVARDAKGRVIADKMKGVTRAKMIAEDIIGQADKVKREKLIHEQGMLTRSDVEEQWRKAIPNANDIEIDAVMLLIDMHSDTLAKQRGITPSLASRDAYYASHFEKITGEKGNVELKQAGQADWYYSQLGKVLDTMPNKITPEALRGFLNGKVKADELAWTGFDKWVGEQTGSISKQDALDFIQEHQVKVEEVVHGKSDIPNTSDYVAIDNKTGIAEMGDSDITSLRNRMLAAGFNEGDITITKNPTADPKYSDYTLPGGKNYRELLLTMPVKSPLDATEQAQLTILQKSIENVTEQKRAVDNKVDFDHPEKWTDQDRQMVKESNLLAKQRADYQNEITLLEAKPASGYKSAHWSEPNVLAHIRFDDRVDADGKRVLFIEEIQSDWHQKGREEGYKSDFEKLLTPDEVELRELNGKTWHGGLTDTEKARMAELQKTVGDSLEKKAAASGTDVPDAPFKKNWDELAIKRAIRYAAENGYDRVAWTTGKMQADRYNLAKQVDAIRILGDPDQGLVISAAPIGKGFENVATDVPVNKLADYVGKEIAEKYLSNGQTEFTGVDLAVGGEGMKGFYDQKIPAIVNKYIKKWGSQVGEAELAGDNVRWEVRATADDAPQVITDQNELQQFILSGYLVNEINGNGKVPVFDITDSMRKSVVEEGQPLFQDDISPKGGVSFGKDGRAVIRAFKSPDVSTMVHELGHIFRRDLSDAHLDVVAKLGGLKDGAELRRLEEAFANKTLSQGDADYSRYVQAEEAFARGWERYLAEGDAPTPALRSVFKQFTNWMLNIYKKLFKQNGRVGGFEGTELNIDLNQMINGVSLRDIFDRMLTDEPNRPKSFDQLVSERAADLKNEGRNWRFSPEELTAMAQKEIAGNVLDGWKNADEARANLDSMTDYKVLKDGTKVDDTVIYDALNHIEQNAASNPWNVKAPQVEGTRTTARGISDPTKEFEFQFKVIDLDDIQTSDMWVGDALKPNPNFMQELQPRNRSEKQSVTQVETIARDLIPDELLFDGKDIQRGAPVVGPDGMIESGNGRALAMKRAAEMYPLKWQGYQEALKAQVVQYGIDPASIEGMKNPVLIRERTTALTAEERVAFVNDANKPIAASMNPGEVALNDAVKITDPMLRILDVLDNEDIFTALSSPRNSKFVNRFLEQLAPTERTAISTDGTINQSGINRIVNALFAKVYPGVEGERMITTFMQSLDSNVKTLQSAVMASLPQVAVSEGLIKSGLRPAELSIANDVAKTVDMISNIRHNGMSAEEYLGQMNLFGENPKDAMTPVQQAMLVLFDQKKPAKIREFLRNYARLVEAEPAVGQMSVAELSRSKLEVVNDALTNAKQPGLFGADAGAGTAGSTASPATSLPDNQLAKPNTGTDNGVGAIPDGSEGLPRLVEQEVIPARPGDIARESRTNESRTDYAAGKPVAIDKAETIDLAHNEVLPVSPEVQAILDKANYFKFEQKKRTKEYLQWIVDGEKGLSPEMDEVALSTFTEHDIDVLREYAAKKASGVSIKEPWQIKGEQALQDIMGYSPEEAAAISASVINGQKTWEVTLDEFLTEVSNNKYRSDIALNKAINSAKSSHKMAVRQAMSEGKPVPMNVLADYPDLAPHQPGINIQKVYAFTHGEIPCIANVYKDGKLIAYLPEMKLTDARIDDSSRILGLDPQFPDHIVYEQDGVIKSVDSRKPKVEQSGLFQQGQADFFSNTAEDLPLFSGAPMRAEDVAFRPQAESPQMSMFDIVPEAKPTRIIEIAIKENGRTAYVRLDLKRMKQLRETLKLHEGAEMTARIMDAKGKVLESNLDPNQIVSPMLFQDGIRVENTNWTPEMSENIARALVRQAEKEGDNELAYGVLAEPNRKNRIAILDAAHDLNAPLAERVAKQIGNQLFQDAEAEPMSSPDAPMGKVPLNGTPAIEPFSRVLDEVNSEQIRPMLADIRSEYKKKLADKSFQWGQVADEHKKAVRQYLDNDVRNDLSSLKRTALTYGDTMRNNAMLDYSRRYGFDQVLNTIFPYQFWYTRTMLNWAKRMVDKPSWFAMYARMQQAQQRMEREGMPTRLNGKVRIAMPWMPDWMGGGIWVDPSSKIFPFQQFGQPFEQYAMNRNQVFKRAEQIVSDMRAAETITSVDAQSAINDKKGSIWDRAVSQAEQELDKSSSPASMAGMMMQPALWWQIPTQIAKGTPEKLSPLPITRTGQTIRDLGSDTFLEPVTNAIGGLLAGGEETMRKSAGLSQFGQWGDYYLDRTLAGMAADGEISADDARIAMIQRSGPAFQEATRRVTREQTLRTPGALGIVAAKEGANPAQVLAATLAGIFGGSLFSEGELKMRGLKPIYDNAWNKLEAGDDQAINKFFDDYPEYSARLALYDKPEERLHQFLIDSIWNKYMELDAANKKLVNNALGDEFETSFLNKETRDYTAIDDKTLAYWSQTIKKTDAPTQVADVKGQQMNYYDDPMLVKINEYKATKDKKFPYVGQWQTEYYRLPAGAERKAFLAQHPDLKGYWDWKDQYAVQHPDIVPYFEDLKTTSTADETSSELTSPLIRQLMTYATGGSLSAGAKSELERIRLAISPELSEEEFLKIALNLVINGY